MMTCPFKYSETKNYCSCPYPKREMDYTRPLEDLEIEWRQHFIELDNIRKQENEMHSI